MNVFLSINLNFPAGFLIVSPRFQSCHDNRYLVNVTHAFLPLISFPKLGGILSLPQDSSHTILPAQSPQLARLSLILNLFLSFLIHYIHPRDHFLIKFEVADNAKILYEFQNQDYTRVKYQVQGKTHRCTSGEKHY